MRSLALLASVLLGACSFTPKYERPAAPIANAFPDASTGTAADRLGWRDVFADPRLQGLVELALRNNRDLRLAALNVELARAQYQIQRAPLLPDVAAAGSAQLQGGANPFNPNAGPGDVIKLYRVGASASYEVDLFGRVRNLKDAALQDYLGTVEAQRAAHLALVGEVATQYLRARAFEEQHALAEQTVAVVQEAAAMTQRMFDAGQRSDLDVRTAEAQVQAARADVARLARARALAHNALALLIGQPLPAGLPAGLPLDGQPIVAELGAGVPSDVLVRRPDILAAEHALRAANYNVGAARAAFFPNISLTGFAGIASRTLAGLVGAGFAWSFTPQINVPLFTGGRNRASLDVAQVRKRIEIARYERAIQGAFREVADALAARATFDAQLEAQVARAAAEQRRYEISETRYRNGVESYLTVLAAQQDLYGTQQQLIELRFARLANLVDLYRALGGGWHERTP